MSLEMTRGIRLASRRRFLQRSPLFFATCAIAACSHKTERVYENSRDENNQALLQAQSRLPTPTCQGETATLSQTSGPFYKPNSPQRRSLLTPNTQGDRLTITGQVLTTGCTPIANSLIDVWQADAQGAYDNDGDTLRGHQFTDRQGRYSLETIVPGIYPGRTRHLHVRVQALDYPMLTTQLYLPQEPLNERDFLFQPELLMVVEEAEEGKQAHFDFVLG